MENIRKEMEKLFCYCLDREALREEDIDEICTKRIGNHIFDMVSAIAEKKQRQALELYYELLAQKEPPMRILFLIARQFNLLLQVKELRGKSLPNKAMGKRWGCRDLLPENMWPRPRASGQRKSGMPWKPV